MFEEILSQQNPHWEQTTELFGTERFCFSKLLDYIATGQIVSITGVRRAGKSILVKQLIHYLIHSQKINSKNILFFNLEHPHISPHKEDSLLLQNIYEDYLKMMQPKGKIYIFLDEVQFFREWPVFVKAHDETKKIQFVVTGSNAIMLSSDLITLLSGRSLPLEVFPFSLRELAIKNNISITSPLKASANAPKIKQILDQMLEYGGFPIVVTNKLNQASFDILAAHAKTVLLQDVAPRLNLRKPDNLEKLYVYLVSNISKLFSYHSLSKTFDISDKSVKEYIQALVESYLIFELDIFSYSLKKQIKNPKKVYAIDTGQANAMGFKFSQNKGRLLENLILIDLKRLSLEVYYYKTQNDKEVDFVIKKGNQIVLIQVSLNLNDKETLEREVSALQQAMVELKVKKAFIITLDRSLKNLNYENITFLRAHNYLGMDQDQQIKLLFN